MIKYIKNRIKRFLRERSRKQIEKKWNVDFRLEIPYGEHVTLGHNPIMIIHMKETYIQYHELWNFLRCDTLEETIDQDYNGLLLRGHETSRGLDGIIRGCK